jgi:NAD(P)H-nitrite reductase large subunit
VARDPKATDRQPLDFYVLNSRRRVGHQIGVMEILNQSAIVREDLAPERELQETGRMIRIIRISRAVFTEAPKLTNGEELLAANGPRALLIDIPEKDSAFRTAHAAGTSILVEIERYG